MVTFLVQTACAAAPADPLQAAVKNYENRQYGQAIQQLQHLSGAAAKSPRAHYYLGLSYQALGRYGEAEKEFRWNYENSADRDIRYKSWQGLNGLASMKAGRTSTRTSVVSSDDEAGSKPLSASDLVGTRHVTSAEEFNKRFTTIVTPGCPRHR